MAQQLFTNNARTTLAATITNTATSLTVVDASGFPSGLSGGTYFLVTLIGRALDGAELTREIVKVTAVNNKVWTIVRAQEGTTAQTWVADTELELRVTADILNALLKREDAIALIEAAIATHNTSNTAHPYIRGLISALG